MEAFGTICLGLRPWKCPIEKSICCDILTFSAFFSFLKEFKIRFVDLGLVVSPLGKLTGLPLGLATF